MNLPAMKERRNDSGGMKLRMFKPENKDGAEMNGFEVNKFRVGQHAVMAARAIQKGNFMAPQEDINKFRIAQHVVRGAQEFAGSAFFIPRSTTEARLFGFNRKLLLGSEFRFQIPPPLDEKIVKIMDKFYDKRPLTLEYTFHRDQTKRSDKSSEARQSRIPVNVLLRYCKEAEEIENRKPPKRFRPEEGLKILDRSLSTTRVRQRLCNLMGTDVIRLNDKRYFQKLSSRLQEEYESEMDKEEDARMASENERLRRLMLEGIIENPHDYRAIIHGEHTQHRRTKKKKRSKRKKRPESSQKTEDSKTVTTQGSEEEREEDEEVITQVEYLTRPGSSAGVSSTKTKKTSTKKDRKSGVDQKGGEKENQEEKRFAEMHAPPPHRPSSSCALRRKRLKSAAPRVSHWDQSSSESSDGESDADTKSLPEPRQSKYQWRYSKKEKPLVKSLRQEETVAGLYAIAEVLISPIKTEDTAKKVHVAPVKKKKMTIQF